MMIILGRECRDWCDETADLEIRQIDSLAEDDDAVVYTDGSVTQDHRLGWGFFVTVSGRISFEQVECIEHQHPVWEWRLRFSLHHWDSCPVHL